MSTFKKSLLGLRIKHVHGTSLRIHVHYWTFGCINILTLYIFQNATSHRWSHESGRPWAKVLYLSIVLFKRSLWKYPEQKWWKKIKFLKSSFSNVLLSLSEDLLYYIGLIFHNRTIAHSVPRKWLLERNTLVELTLSTFHLTVILFTIKKLLIYVGKRSMTFISF